uniref:Small subunit ribosomal protein 17 n=1 Tax=Leucocytozoon caulleryi TaxID=211597 RepID=U3TRT9_LEUCU|nr:small subunit ribosomal protein 17 [Leucocytozoon caulleryi]BAN94673.1 small subunit ribosomal protein 17 [Leucocytozoon caulleryi]
MNYKIGYVIKSLNKNIKIIYFSIYIYNKKYKKLLVKNLYFKVYDYRNELINNDYILFKFFKKSKYCIYKLVKIL